MLFNVDALEAIEKLVAMEEESLELTSATPSLFELVCLFPLSSNKTASTNIEEVLLFDEADEFLSDSDIIL